MHHRKRPHDGFTLIELLVAITVTILMMGLVNLVFVQMTVIVGKGTAASKMLGSSRTMREQLARDARGMKGPGPFGSLTSGFLVIVNQQIPSVEIATGTGATITRIVNSDQLFFFYDNTGVNTIAPLSPRSPGGFASSALGADTVRIWWGHVRVTDADGTDAAIDAGTPESKDAMDRPLGSQWVLGRQALFLGGTSTIISANDARDNVAAVTGYGGSGFPGKLNTAGSGLYLYMGLTDITPQSAADIFDPSAAGVFRPLAAPGAYNSYPTTAVNFGFANRRLRANPLPEYDPGEPNYEYSYASWQIAQMHPIFMENVSDFIVEFAGDYDGITGLDVDSTTGEIIWYRHFADAAANTEPPLVSGGAFNTGSDPTPDSGPRYIPAPGDPVHADAYFVFRHDNDGVTPYPAGNVTLNYWPHLLRIRYRVHDRNGRIIGADGTPGKWFEHVIKVNDNRP